MPWRNRKQRACVFFSVPPIVIFMFFFLPFAWKRMLEINHIREEYDNVRTRRGLFISPLLQGMRKQWSKKVYHRRDAVEMFDFYTMYGNVLEIGKLMLRYLSLTNCFKTIATTTILVKNKVISMVLISFLLLHVIWRVSQVYVLYILYLTFSWPFIQFYNQCTYFFIILKRLFSDHTTTYLPRVLSPLRCSLCP